MDKSGGVVPRKVAILLVIVALILLVISLSVHFVSSGERVEKSSGGEDSSGAKVGIEIISPEVEDKGLEEGGLNG